MNQAAVVQQLIQQLLSMVPGGPLLGSFTPMISQWVSPASSMANRFVWPNEGETVSMASIQNLNNVISGSFGSTAGISSQELHLRALDRYNKLLNPGRSNKEIRVMSESMANNPMNIPSFVLSHLDPYGANAGMAEASTLAATLQKRGGGPISLSGAKYASDISNAIFGADGKSGIVKDIIDRPGAYGNMKLADVMKIGQELVHTDATGFNDNGKFNSDRFKQSVKQMSQALEPWKDVFGTDIPELMRQLEALTGQGIAVQRSSLKASGSRMAAVMQATGANVQNITAYRDALAQGMKDPTMANRSILGAHSVAADMVLGTANSGRGSMTTEEFQRESGKYYAATAASKFTDKYALAYSKWANETTDVGFRATALNRNELYNRALKAGFSEEAAAKFADRHIDASHKEFRAAYNKAESRGLSHDEAVEAASNEVKAKLFQRKYREARESGLSHDEALKKVSGARNNSDYEVYRNTRYYLDSIKSGDAARANRDDIDRALGKEFIEDYANNKGQYAVGSDTVRNALKAMSPEQLTDFMALDKDAKVKYLRDNKLVDRHTSDKTLFRMVDDMHASYAKVASGKTGSYVSKENASRMAQNVATERRNAAQAAEYEKFSEAVRRISDPGGFQGLLEKIEKSNGNISIPEAIKSFTGGVSILDGIIEAGIFKDGKTMDAKSIRNAAHFALNNYTSLATDYKDIYNDVMNSSDGAARERGMKMMAALGGLGQKQLGSMTKETRDAYIAKLKERISKADPKADITKLAKDTYIDQKMGDMLTEFEKGDTDKKYATDIGKMRKILSDNVVSSMEELKTLATKAGISEDTYKEFAAASGAGDVDGVEPIARLCQTLEKLADWIKQLVQNMPVNDKGK